MKQDKHTAGSVQLMRIIRPALSQIVNSGIRGGSAVIANLWPDVTAALAEAERAIEAFAQAYAAVRRAMATTAPK